MNKPAHVDSYYAASASALPDYAALDGEARADVCVVGAGLTGASCALELARRGYRVRVLEACRVGWGASGRSGGQLIFGYSCGEDTLEKLLGLHDARTLWEMSLEALDLVRERVREYDIDCDLAPGHLHAAVKPRHLRELQAWARQLQDRYGYRGVELWDRESLRSRLASERYVGGLYDPNSGHLHPLNYTLGLVQAADRAGVVFHENSRVIRIRSGREPEVITGRGSVRCRHVVLAGNAYLGDLNGRLAARIMPVGTYIGASRPLAPARAEALIRGNFAVADTNFVLDYYRLSADHRMLFGGRVSYSTLEPPHLTTAMARRMLNVFPQLADVAMEFAWGGYVGITRNRAPDFGRIEKNVFYAQGFSGHGVALTGLAGKLMAEAVAGTAERFDLFSRIPHRDFPGGARLRTPALVLAMLWYRLRDRL